MSWDSTLRQVGASLDAKAPDQPKGFTSPAVPVLSTDDDAFARFQVNNGPETWVRIPELVSVSPEAAVMIAFTEVEKAVRQVADYYDVPKRERLGVRQLLRRMSEPAFINDAVANLSTLRNEVAHHSVSVDEGDALE
jgi:hypothetical protein